MRKIILIIAVLLLTNLAFADTGVLGDKPAPDFTVTDIDNNQVTLSELLKKGPVVVDFWALWCVPCKQALRAYSQLHTELAEQYPGVSFVAVSIDKTRKVNKAKAFIKPDRYNFIKAFDPQGRLQDKYGVKNIPYTVLISTDGKIIWQHNSFQAGDEQLLKQQIVRYMQAQTTEAGE